MAVGGKYYLSPIVTAVLDSQPFLVVARDGIARRPQRPIDRPRILPLAASWAAGFSIRYQSMPTAHGMFWNYIS